MTTSEFIKTVSFHALGWGVSAEATYDLAMLALQRGIPGDFVECGVYAGASSALMARALLDFEYRTPEDCYDRTPLTDALFGKQITRRVHLFDSFQGMPAADPVDEEQWREHGNKTGMAKVSLPEVQANMQRWGIPPELLLWHPGWFEETMPVFAGLQWGYGNKIAVLRLDADLYSSTKVVMKHLYPLVSPGGWVIVDDYHLSGCKKAVHEVVNPGPVYWRKI